MNGSTSDTAHKPSILVVDDELGYRDGIRRILAGRGYQACAVGNGREALELIVEGDFPIALVDLKMPELDGFELIEKVREIKPSTLCIVVSAFATIESAVQTTKMGAFDFVVKPFMPDDLMVVVNRAAETWKLASEAERLRAEREAHMLELSAEKSRLRTIIQSVAEGILVVNIDGVVVLDNPITRRVLGKVYSPRLDGPVADVIRDRRFLAEIGRMLRGEAAEVGITMEIEVETTPPDEPHFARATLAPMRDERGGVLGVVVLLADITKAKAFDRMKSRFVSMVAHELKAPLGAVEGYLHLIRDGAFDGQPDKRSEVIGRCLSRTGALIELIQDLLQITRPEITHRDKRIEPLDVVEVCRSIVEFHRHDAGRRAIQIGMDLPGGAISVLVDKGDLERMLVNLISNAIKYNRDGGLVTVSAVAGEGVAKIEVRDSGIGMSLEEQKRLGEEFYRVNNERTRHIAGTGLGLALVKKTVESYGGALEVQSSPGDGSTFRVVLPLGGETSSIPSPERQLS
jgi:two-component system, OmpR family, phosphate regulon sensor histidine kinase PhoR